MMNDLLADEKLQIMRFVCAFAWADLKIHEAERALINRFIDALEINEEGKIAVEDMMKRPPRPEDIDPYDLAPELRETVIQAAEAMTVTDGEISPREKELMKLLRDLYTEDSTSKHSSQAEN